MTAPTIIALWFAASIPVGLLAGRFMAPRLHDVKDQEPRDQYAESLRARLPFGVIDTIHGERK